MSKISQKYPNYSTISFEDRQKMWRGEPREFRQHHGRAERPTVWTISVDGDRVFTQHGLLGGAAQKTDYVGKAKNIDKANAISTEQDALAEARRDVRKKWDFEGFDEYLDDVNIDRRHENIDIQALLTNLPGSFCLYKPENNLYDQKRLLEKAKAGNVLYTCKRDGVAKWIVVDYYGNVAIYSRRSRPWQDKEGPKELPDGTLDYSTVVPWTARFPHLVEAVRELGLPNGTMMAVELVKKGGDNFRYISGLTKGYTERALFDMNLAGLPSIYWWDLPFYGGSDLVSTQSVEYRHALIRKTWQRSGDAAHLHIEPITTLGFRDPDLAIAYAKRYRVEGFVVVDPLAVYGDRGWNLKGKPDRPSTCAKLKPAYEDDFVVMWDPDRAGGPKKGAFGEWGLGKHERGKAVTLPDGSNVVHGGVGSVGLWQYNDKGELIFISKCAGLDYAFQAKLRKDDFPAVWQVEYSERTYISDGDDTNALWHPRFLRTRDDKKAEECINSRL